MKKFSVAEFEAFVRKASFTSGWERQVEEEYHGDDQSPRDVYCGLIFNELEHDGGTLRCDLAFTHPVGKPSMAKFSEGGPGVWFDDVEGFMVIDEDGAESDFDSIHSVLAERGMFDFDLSSLGEDDVMIEAAS